MPEEGTGSAPKMMMTKCAVGEQKKKRRMSSKKKKLLQRSCLGGAKERRLGGKCHGSKISHRCRARKIREIG